MVWGGGLEFGTNHEEMLQSVRIPSQVIPIHPRTQRVSSGSRQARGGAVGDARVHQGVTLKEQHGGEGGDRMAASRKAWWCFWLDVPCRKT